MPVPCMNGSPCWILGFLSLVMLADQTSFWIISVTKYSFLIHFFLLLLVTLFTILSMHVVSLVRRHCFFFSSSGILSWWILFRSCSRGLCSSCSCSTHLCCWCCTYCISHANSMVRMDCILLQNEHWRMV